MPKNREFFDPNFMFPLSVPFMVALMRERPELANTYYGKILSSAPETRCLQCRYCGYSTLTITVPAPRATSREKIIKAGFEYGACYSCYSKPHIREQLLEKVLSESHSDSSPAAMISDDDLI